MSEKPNWDLMCDQYEAPPASGLDRYWIGIRTWAEEWRDLPFFNWVTGYGAEYRYLPSVIEAAKAIDPVVVLPPLDEISEDEVDEKCYSETIMCLLVDARSESAALEVVRQHFPDAELRFSEASPDMTLSGLAEGGRFLHPRPVETEPAPFVG